MGKVLIKLIPVILILIVALLVVGFINLRSKWKTHSRGATVMLSFKQFEKMYNVAPKRYDLGELGTVYQSDMKHFNICFSFEDYCAYHEWLKKLVKDKQFAEAIENRKEYIECVKKDIDAFRDELEEGIQAMRELHL